MNAADITRGLVATDQPITPERPTHQVIAERLRLLADQAKGATLDNMQQVYHKGLDAVLYAGPMSYDDMCKWQNLRRFEDIKHKNGDKTADDPQDRRGSDEWLIGHAIYTSDGMLLGEDIAKQLMTLPGAGPSNVELAKAAATENPPREELARESAVLLSKSSFDLIIWQMLLDLGLGRVLIDAMAPSATPEERAHAEEQIAKISSIVYSLSPIFMAKETAQTLGITLGDGMSLIAQYGDSKTAIEATRQQQEE